jgi:hypothetical protein
MPKQGRKTTFRMEKYQIWKILMEEHRKKGKEYGRKRLRRKRYNSCGSILRIHN